jgi:hypothetical protein
MAWADTAERLCRGAIRPFKDRGPAVYLPKNGDEFEVVGTFDDPYTEVELGGNAPVGSQTLLFGIVGKDISEFASYKDGDRLRRSNGTLYRIIAIEPDGQAGVTLRLKVADAR